MSTSNLKLKTSTALSTMVVGAGGIQAVKANGVVTVSPDVGALAPHVMDESELETIFFPSYNIATEINQRISADNIISFVVSFLPRTAISIEGHGAVANVDTPTQRALNAIAILAALTEAAGGAVLVPGRTFYTNAFTYGGNANLVGDSNTTSILAGTPAPGSYLGNFTGPCTSVRVEKVAFEVPVGTGLTYHGLQVSNALNVVVSQCRARGQVAFNIHDNTNISVTKNSIDSYWSTAIWTHNNVNHYIAENEMLAAGHVGAGSGHGIMVQCLSFAPGEIAIVNNVIDEPSWQGISVNVHDDFSDGLIIAGNRIRGRLYETISLGVTATGIGGYKNFLVCGNILTFNPAHDDFGIDIVAGNGTFRNGRVADNVIVGCGGTALGLLDDCQDLTVENNLIVNPAATDKADPRHHYGISCQVFTGGTAPGPSKNIIRNNHIVCTNGFMTYAVAENNDSITEPPEVGIPGCDANEFIDNTGDVGSSAFYRVLGGLTKVTSIIDGKRSAGVTGTPLALNHTKSTTSAYQHMMESSANKFGWSINETGGVLTLINSLTDAVLMTITPAGAVGIPTLQLFTGGVISGFDADVTLAANSDFRVATQKAVKAYADALIAAQDAMVFKGVIDASANPNYPAADRGHTYRISVAGKIGGGSGPNVEAGDLIIALTDGTVTGTHAAVGSSWTISQANLDGAVIGPASATNNGFAKFDGTTGKLIKDSAATIALGSEVSGDLPLANLTQGSALSVLGVTGNATADHASIAAASDHQVLRRSGTAVGFGAVALDQSAAVSGALPVAKGGTGQTSSPGLLRRCTVFTASGTWTKGADVSFVVVEVVGPGGGGGGAPVTAGGEISVGAGGGGGGYSYKFIAAPGATETVTVGTAGAGGVAGANAGETSGNSSFGAHCTANAGGGGGTNTAAAAQISTAGAGGTATGGDLNLVGSAGAGGWGLASFAAFGGNGGAAARGGGGGRGGLGATSAPTAGGNYGGGGGGAANHSSEAAEAGQAGAAGLVIVSEYQ